MKAKLLNLLKHELVSGTFYMFVGGMIGSFFSFLLNLFFARTLSYADYGSYTSLLALETLLAIPAGTLASVIVRFASHYFGNKDIDRASLLYKKMLILWGVIASVAFITILLFSNLILLYLHLSDIRLIIIFAVSVSISYFGIVNSAFLQSLTKFAFISFSGIVSVLSRIAFGGGLVFLGFGLVGAMTGLIAFPLAPLLLGFFPLFFLFKIKNKNEKVSIDSKEMILYAIPVSIGLISLSSFFTTDLILVKHFFHGDLAGLYGGLSIVGKVIFYFTGAIPMVMFPLVVKRHAKGENYRNLYFVALGLTALPSLALTAFYFIFPNFVINFFLGGKGYLAIAPYLGFYAIFISLYNFLSLTVNFFISLKKTIVSFIVFFFAFLQFVLIYLFHTNFYQIIFDGLISISLLLTILLLYFLKEERHKR